MSKQCSGEGVTVAPSGNIYSCLQTSFVRKENGYINCTLKIRTEDLTTGNLLSTAEIEPGSNNISHNEKKGKVSLSEISLVLASCLTYEVTF